MSRKDEARLKQVDMENARLQAEIAKIQNAEDIDTVCHKILDFTNKTEEPFSAYPQDEMNPYLEKASAACKCTIS